MLESGKYGIMAEANGTIVIERGYHDTPVLYVPMENVFRPDIALSPTKFTVVNYSIGEYLPGIYNNTLKFFTSNNFSGNISIQACINGHIAETTYINSSTNHEMEYNVSFSQTFSEIEKSGYYYFIIKSNGFNGNISFDGISIKQNKPNYN